MFESYSFSQECFLDDSNTRHDSMYNWGWPCGLLASRVQPKTQVLLRPPSQTPVGLGLTPPCGLPAPDDPSCVPQCPPPDIPCHVFPFPPSLATFHYFSPELPTLNPSCHPLPGCCRSPHLPLPIFPPSAALSLRWRGRGWTGRTGLLCYPSPGPWRGANQMPHDT